MIRNTLSGALRFFDRGLSHLVRGGFGLKDVFTLVNLLGGVASICFAIQGNIKWASAAVMLGYLGDVLDGPVARLTGRGNLFGSELDSIADHLSQCVAPSFVVFLFYRGVSVYLGFGLAALMIATGSIRHARAAAVPFRFSLCWNGMPRPVTAFIVLSFLNSQILHWVPAGEWVAVALICVVSVMNLVSIPFLNHHGRRLQLYVKVAVVTSFAVVIGLALVAPDFFWDVLFVIVFGYAVTSWIPLSREECREFFAEARRWRNRLEAPSPQKGYAGQSSGSNPSGAVVPKGRSA